MRFRIGPVLSIVVLGASLASGDVVTTVSGSKLIVTGDDSPDALSVESIPDGVRVIGLYGTLVDGSSLGATFSGVERVTVKLGKGGDHLTVTALTLPKALKIRLGKGDDVVVLEHVSVGATSISTGNGNDSVGIFDSRLNSLFVQTSNGEDVVALGGVWIPGELDIDTGADDDYVEVVGTEVGDDVHVHLGNDDDVLALSDIAFDDDTELDGEHGDNALWYAGYIWFGHDVDIDGFWDDDDWWW